MLDANLIPPAPPELLRPITVGTIVRLRDDSVAEVVSSYYETVTVEHGYLRAANIPGSGPWTYLRYQVELASELEANAYRAMVADATARAAKAIVQAHACCSQATHAALRASDTAWSELDLLGTQSVEADEFGPAETLEVRNCSLCHSTLSREVAL